MVVYTLLKKHAIAVFKCQKNGPSDQSEMMQDQSWPQGAHVWTPGIATAVTITASRAPLSEGTAHRRIIYQTLAPSSASAVSVVKFFRVDWTQVWLRFD